ncbi:MAG: thioredoxin family protein [Deltaproteobacteria bacterium]|nr:thioredoxin family protein [Deltaproteobacteria bacterium]
MSKKTRKAKKRQAASRNRKRRQAVRHQRKPSASGKGSEGKSAAAVPAVAKTGDLYHVRSQAELNALLVSGKPTLVDFWAPWCQPCLLMGPIFERMAARYGEQIHFAKVDTQSAPQVGSRYGVKSIPTVIAFVGKKEAKREVGLMNERKMQLLAERFLPEEEEEELDQALEAEPEEQAEQTEQEERSASSPEKPSPGLIKRLFGGKK